LSFYNGQITALLGHNGACKTTTISMLTGAIAPTSGYATIMGKDIRSQVNEIRSDIGICLQHDCLFPQLTVREHVQFFSRLKGLYSKMSKAEAEEQIDQLIKDVALSEKSNTPSSKLSGGMKRKLSVAMAFCGGSTVVFLDEPTSGMDPFSRRFTWNIIRDFRKGRCIILTTHFMDEADILGDRVAIMAEGQLRCCGSSLFLKKTYGVGYQLTIEKVPRFNVKANATGEDYDLDAIAGSEIDIDDYVETVRELGLETELPVDETLNNIVKGNVKEATLLSNVGSEMSFQLPLESSSKFVPMLQTLDTQIQRGAISTYGVSVTTLDEVFLLVARGDEKEKTQLESTRVKTGAENNQLMERSYSTDSQMDLDKPGLFTTHLTALVKKASRKLQTGQKGVVLHNNSTQSFCSIRICSSTGLSTAPKSRSACVGFG